ncbi:MAG TPA: BamA/TamA family outer membrane protein [Myxococcota bacterium]|jgi:outer membrane protein assembly factor BamA|nr:BamA/TamA family outer membrane protein [Myxococcota bacterium]
MRSSYVSCRAASALACVLAAVLAPPAAAAADPGTAETRPSGAPASLPEPVPPEDETDLGDPGYVLERIEILGNAKTSNALILSLMSLRLGAPWNEREGRIARLALLTTGYFTDVTLSLARGSRPGWVALRVKVKERNTLLLTDLFAASSPVVPAVFGMEVSETNLFGAGSFLSGAFVAGTGQAAFRLRWHDPSVARTPLGVGASLLFTDATDFFGFRCRVLTPTTPQPPDPDCADVADALPGALDWARLRYRRAGGSVGVSWAFSALTALYADLRAELLWAAYAEGAVTRPVGAELDEPVDFSIVHGRSRLVSLVLSLERDSRDHPYLPRSGTLLTLTAELSHTALGSSYSFAKVVAHAQRIWRVRRNDALKLDVLAGAVFGATPFFNRFFIGDVTDLVPYRNLEVAASARPAPTLLPSSVDRMRYEDYVARAAVEYAIPVKESIGEFFYGIDLFLRFGVYALFSSGDWRARPGDTLPWRPPVDLTFDFGLRVDTVIGDFGLSLGNFIGVYPL